MINEITLEIFLISFSLLSIIISISRDIFKRKKLKEELKEEIGLLKKEIRRRTY